MATDNTPPRLRLIATIATIVVITLIGLNFVMRSYFTLMTDEAQREKIAPTSDKTAQIAAEKASFEGAKMPIGQAMAQLAVGRPELIEPKQSEDLGALTGWSKLPHALPAGAGAAHTTDLALDGGAATAEGGVTEADGGITTATDAGIAIATDAGAHPTTTVTDAGVHAPALDAGAAKDAGVHAPQAPQPAPQH